MTEYPNWFAMGAVHSFCKNLLPLAGQKLDVLQVGAYTGDATLWMLENILTHPESTITDVDTWGGSDEPEHKELNWNSVEEVYDSKLAIYLESGKVKKIKTTSNEFFAAASTNLKYDFIYVDGDHKAASVLKDGINATNHIAENGIIAFDDYMWSLHKGPAYDPKPAIDAIINCYSDQFDLIDLGLQAWLRKK